MNIRLVLLIVTFAFFCCSLLFFIFALVYDKVRGGKSIYDSKRDDSRHSGKL